jgi:transcriptional regulator GlxA family with amidase domain
MDRRVQTIIAIMKNDLHRELHLSALARKVDLSTSRLHHLFKAETGTTPALYLHSLRIKRAKELLEIHSLSIKQIMIHIGVKDRSHFERSFKRVCGLTPTQYRAGVQRLEPTDEI